MRPDPAVVFMDTETTGLDPDRHEVWELALGWWDEDGAWWERAWHLPVDLARADLIALGIGRFHDRFQLDPWYPAGDATDVKREVCIEVEAVTRGKHIVGAVPSFDTERVGRLMRQVGLCPSWHYQPLDIETLIAGKLFTLPRALGMSLPLNSSDLSRAIGVEPSDFDRHTALGDVLWCRAMWEAL